jgi:hypothetical protein
MNKLARLKTQVGMLPVRIAKIKESLRLAGLKSI